ncbi:MAG: hypothetical protein DSZ27_06730 [Thiomicrospira sp.]|nr:MAG: hypothetical protein DSZ27_06730 [Thiomicrospira sp.]
MVTHACDFPWSSTRVHSRILESELLTALPPEYNPANSQDWPSYLDSAIPVEYIDNLRRKLKKVCPAVQTRLLKGWNGCQIDP